MELYVIFDSIIKDEATQKLINTLKKAEEDDIENITIFFSSRGGDVNQGFLLASLIRNSKIPVIMHAINNIDSIANVIYLSAKQRSSESYAKFFLHSTSIGGTFDHKQLVEQLSSVKTGNKRIAQFIYENSNLSLNEARDKINKAKSLSAQEALNCGIVQEIISKEIPQNAKREEIIYI